MGKQRERKHCRSVITYDDLRRHAGDSMAGCDLNEGHSLPHIHTTDDGVVEWGLFVLLKKKKAAA